MQKKKAISLIVLVITIIVMIVLAGAIILSLNNAGIINRANEAVAGSNLATAKTVADLAWADAYNAGVRTVEGENGFQARVEKSLQDAGINKDDFKIKITTNGVDIKEKAVIPADWTSSVVDIVDGVPIPKGFVASPYGASGDIKAENTKAGGLVIYELNDKPISEEDQYTSWTTRNQYVWVPVDNSSDTAFANSFKRQNFGMSYEISSTLGTSSKYWEVLPTTELSTENLKYITEDTLEEVQAMYASVKEYGGFYIARYEAGIDEQRREKGSSGSELPGIKEGTKVYSAMNKIPYNHMPWTWNNSMSKDTGGAVEVARKMYPESNSNYGVVSTLTYGVQWDRTVQWFVDTGVMTENQVNKTEGSTEFGNYNDHVIAKSDLNDGALVWDYSTSSSGSYVSKDSNTLTYPKASGKSWALSTGALKDANINNIYDMAGNMYEWTMEGYSTFDRAIRGGSFIFTGTDLPVAYCDGYNPNTAASSIGFRPSLYIK